MRVSDTLVQKLRYYSVDKVPRACESLMHEAADEIEHLCELLRLVQSDRGNWLHSRLQERIEAAVGPPGAYRDINDDDIAKSGARDG